MEKVLYHATYKKYLPSIKKNGLVINSGNCSYEGQVGDEAVYLANDYDVAESFAESAEVDEDIMDTGIVVLEINTSLLDENKFGLDPNIILEEGEEPYSFIYRDNIPVSAITF